MTIRERLGVRPVINLTGTLTTLGGINARPEAIAAAAEMMACGVDMAELQAAANRIIAQVTGAEAGFVASCTAAGLCMAVAGAMTGDRFAAIAQLPDTHGLADRVVIQAGHLVDYGHPIAQDIRLAGAKVAAVGSVNNATLGQLAAAITAGTAAGLYVVSHHCAPDGQIAFADFVRVCHRHGVPVIVDLAAEYDIHGYLAAGADITVHSAHKFLRGATAGVVAGRKTLVRAAFLQSYGIGRTMKVSKEAIAAALVALQLYAAEDRAQAREALRRTLLELRAGPAWPQGVRAELDADPTGNPFDRLRVSVGPEADFEAVDLVRALECGDPPIRVRTHQLQHGSFVLDLRSLRDGEMPIVIAAMNRALARAARDRAEGRTQSVQQWKEARSIGLRRWPDPGGGEGE